MKDIDRIVLLLPKLNPAELKQVLDRVRALLSSGMALAELPTEKQYDPDETFVLSTLGQTLAKLGAEYPALMVLRNHASTSKLIRQKIADLWEFIRVQTEQHHEQHALLSLGFSLLYTDMTRIGFTVSAKTMLNQIDRVPAVLNKAFPDYARAGRLNWAIRSRVQRQNHAT